LLSIDPKIFEQKNRYVEREIILMWPADPPKVKRDGKAMILADNRTALTSVDVQNHFEGGPLYDELRWLVGVGVLESRLSKGKFGLERGDPFGRFYAMTPRGRELQGILDGSTDSGTRAGGGRESDNGGNGSVPTARKRVAAKGDRDKPEGHDADGEQASVVSASEDGLSDRGGDGGDSGARGSGSSHSEDGNLTNDLSTSTDESRPQVARRKPARSLKTA
jgi:hypothetical protein